MMTCLKIFKKYFFIIFILGFFVACDNNSDTSNINLNVDPTLLSLTIGQLQSDGGVAIKIPLEVFGDTEADLENATIEYYQNGGLVFQSLKPADYFHASSNEVMFYIKPVFVDDVLGFLMNTNTGSQLYYEGTVSATGESQAPTGVLSASISAGATYEVGQFFDDEESAVGDATGSSMTGEYLLTLDTMTFSSDCTAEFMSETGFEVSSTMTTDEINALITSGKSSATSDIQITQTDGSFVWDNLANLSDYVGVVNADGTFSIFVGTYLNEANYTYELYNGTFDAEAQSFAGTYTTTYVLDGQVLKNGYAGSCSATAAFSGSLE